MATPEFPFYLPEGVQAGEAVEVKVFDPRTNLLRVNHTSTI